MKSWIDAELALVFVGKHPQVVRVKPQPSTVVLESKRNVSEKHSKQRRSNNGGK